MILKTLRITIASIVLTLSLLFFLDFAGILPTQLHAIMQIQFIPAIMGGMWVIAGGILVSVILFGRVYCSVICPLGIMQDVIAWKTQLLKKIFKKKVNYKKEYKKPCNIARYGFLAATIIPVLFGSTVVVTLLDPYSTFGRICMGIYRPIYVWCNNAIATVANNAGNYTFYQVNESYSLSLFVLAIIALIAITVMTITRGRLWCNTVCPVGTLFGLLSRYSIFGIRISAECGHCNRCSATCKSECIDHTNLNVDNSRCVACFNCIGECKKSAITYGLKSQKDTTTVKSDESRRRFLKGTATAIAMAPVASMAAAVGSEVATGRAYPLPPGAVDDFKIRCTGCQLCVSKCPMHVLRPSFMERGVSGIMQPHLYFKPHAYCNYECTICSDVCPNGALKKLTVDQKKVRQIGIVSFVKEKCVVYKDEYDCGACSEHCPTQAVKMVSYKNGLTIPEIDQSICIGCGACESICPERPNAIFIIGLEPQKEAAVPEQSETEDVVIEGFGF